MLGTAGTWQGQLGKHWSQRVRNELMPRPDLRAESSSRVSTLESLRGLWQKPLLSNF